MVLPINKQEKILRLLEKERYTLRHISKLVGVGYNSVRRLAQRRYLLFRHNGLQVTFPKSLQSKGECPFCKRNVVLPCSQCNARFFRNVDKEDEGKTDDLRPNLKPEEFQRFLEIELGVVSFRGRGSSASSSGGCK